MNLRISALILTATLVGLLSVSCVTTRNSGGDAIACPDCRVVVTYVIDDAVVFDGLDPAEQRRHDCPGCEGFLTSFLKGGKLGHRCSICANSPYTCNVKHPVQSGGVERNPGS